MVQSIFQQVWAAYFSEDENAQIADDFPALPSAASAEEHDKAPDDNEIEGQDPSPELGGEELDKWGAEEEASK